VNVKAKSAFNNKLFALNVVISIPVPDNTAKADIQTTQGMLQPHQLACMQHGAQQVLQHLHSVKTCFDCPQIFVSSDFQCRVDVSE